jgi:hypothetical protein
MLSINSKRLDRNSMAGDLRPEEAHAGSVSRSMEIVAALTLSDPIVRKQLPHLIGGWNLNGSWR